MEVDDKMHASCDRDMAKEINRLNMFVKENSGVDRTLLVNHVK